ncbi:DUF2242 domain-containing protein [Variovorax boronicumulans]|uniref:DUF2242 domain-containing protein n=1 Tax=Variovorax boronicumulans TaxID=436515 RepID=UPI0012E6B829|nr:DUF2242 domain-containing protein [Variovorax boronicumulans]GER14962.1 DUF2242 domain-containing protein [Variovorax boronicumulans]
MPLTSSAAFFSSPARVPAFLFPSLLSVLVLAGCGTLGTRQTYEPEDFDSTTTHTRNYAASEAQTCEAARRALLSQGYMVTAANADLVTARKSFQPAAETHVEVEFRVVCAREMGTGSASAGRSTVAFATALQDRYGLKKGSNSASLGVGAIGSLSLPFGGSNEAMVKVASETLSDERFYDRFFTLVERFLQGGGPDMPADAEDAPKPATRPAATTFPVAPSPNRG